MNKLKLVTTELIPSHWLSAIFNDDFSGYEENDIADIKAFLKQYKRGYKIATFDIKDNEVSFRYCPMISLYADCIEVNIYE